MTRSMLISNKFEEVSNETTIEVHKSHESQNFFQIDRSSSVDYDDHLTWIHAKILFWYNDF